MSRGQHETSDEAGVGKIVDLGARRDTLESRLSDGYRRIDEAMIGGADVGDWEGFWIQLLREYEDVCREAGLAA